LAIRIRWSCASDNYGYVGATETAYQVGNATTTGSLLDADGIRLAVKTGSTVSWLLFDLHGSVAAVCAAASTTLSDAYRYDGFGQQIASAGSVTNPWRYRGLLNLTGDFGQGALLDMGARDYTPQLGVFTQEDSVQGGAANPFTMNRFLYALADPATLVDPDGHMADANFGTGGADICTDASCKSGVTANQNTTKYFDDYWEGDREGVDHVLAPDCGFERLGCRSDSWANLAGLGFGVGQWGWDSVAGVANFGINAISDDLCLLNPFCGPARAREQAEAAQARFDQLGRDWTDPGAALSAGWNGFTGGIGELGDHIFHARSGFEAWREVGYSGANVASVALPVAGGLKAIRMGAALRGGAATSVIVDTNSVLDATAVRRLLAPGELPVMTRVVAAELRNIVARGSVRTPAFARSLRVIEDVMDVDLRISIRGLLKPGQRGLFGDGVIGATAIRLGLPVISKDVDFVRVLQALGVDVRVP
jgi:RHS repeat-associated protein